MVIFCYKCHLLWGICSVTNAEQIFHGERHCLQTRLDLMDQICDFEIASFFAQNVLAPHRCVRRSNIYFRCIVGTFFFMSSDVDIILIQNFVNSKRTGV